MEERDDRESKGRIGGILLIDGPTDNGIQMVPGRRASKGIKALVYESIPCLYADALAQSIMGCAEDAMGLKLGTGKGPGPASNK